MIKTLNALDDVKLNKFDAENFEKIFDEEFNELTNRANICFSADQVLQALTEELKKNKDLLKLEQIIKINELLNFMRPSNQAALTNLSLVIQVTLITDELIRSSSVHLFESLYELSQKQANGVINGVTELYNEAKKIAINSIKNEEIKNIKYLKESLDVVNGFLDNPHDAQNKNALSKAIHQAEHRQFVDYAKKLAYLFSAVLLSAIGCKKASEEKREKSNDYSDTFFARKKFISQLKQCRDSTVNHNPSI